jgi:hypothetical protein
MKIISAMAPAGLRTIIEPYRRVREMTVSWFTWRHQIAAVAYNPLQAEWLTGKRAFVRTSSNQAHYGGAGSFEPRRYRRPRGQARPTGADRGRSSPCARHQPDFDWQAERESYTVKPAEEYAEDCDQPSLAARGARCGPMTL